MSCILHKASNQISTYPCFPHTTFSMVLPTLQIFPCRSSSQWRGFSCNCCTQPVLLHFSQKKRKWTNKIHSVWKLLGPVQMASPTPVWGWGIVGGKAVTEFYIPSRCMRAWLSLFPSLPQVMLSFLSLGCKCYIYKMRQSWLRRALYHPSQNVCVCVCARKA